MSDIVQGYIKSATKVPSPFCDKRPPAQSISLLVIHNISLPPGQFGSSHVDDLFTGRLNAADHPFFEQISHLRVSAHNFIRRNGDIIQYVPYSKRAWHAGISSFQGQQRCNDFSIGIELEGTDMLPYTSEQYRSLVAVTRSIMQEYPQITLGRIVGHCDIAPGRKSDPGVAFDWQRYRQAISTKNQG